MNINIPKITPQTTLSTTVMRKQGSMFEFLIILLVGGLLYWFVLAPKVSSLQAQKTQIATLNQESEKLAQQQGQLDSLVKQLESSTEDIAKLDRSLPLNPRSTLVYLLVENLVQTSGMTVSTLSVSNTDEEIVAGNKQLIDNPFAGSRTVKKMNVHLGVTGTFPQFQALLKKLENSSRLMDIRVLEVSGSSGEILDFRFTFDTYYYSPVGAK